MPQENEQSAVGWTLPKPFSFRRSLIVSLIIVSTSPAIARVPSSDRGARIDATTSVFLQGDEATRWLEPGKPIERELAGSETHSYQIKLTEGEFIYLIVEQHSIDVVATLFGPDSKQILEVDTPNGERWPEQIWYLSAAAGTHKVVVQSSEKEAGAGKYQIRIEEQRFATMADRQRADAQKNLLKGAQLLSQKTDESSKQAADRFHSALDLFSASGNRQSEVDALTNIGQFYSANADREKALEYFHRAQAMARELGEKRREATSLYLIGDEHITSTVERKQEALRYYHQALDLTREAGDRWGECRVVTQLSLTYASLAEMRKAIEYLVPLVELERSLGDVGNAGITLNYIGVCYSHLGDLQKSLDYYNQALPLYRSVKDRPNELIALRNIGAAHLGLGDAERALRYFEEVNALSTNDPDDHAAALHFIGRAYAKLGEPQKALDYHRQALAIWRQLKSRRNEGEALIGIGMVYRDLGDYQAALESFDQALPLKRYVGDRRNEAVILVSTGKIQLSLGNTQKGLDSCRQAFDISKEVGDQATEAQALDGMARAERALGNLAEARTHAEGALSIVESLRARIATRELQTSYYASVQQYHETYIDLLMRLHQLHSAEGYDAMALQASEGARSRGLLESLNEARVDIRSGVDPVLLERERSLRRQLNELHLRLLGGKHTEEQLAALKKDISGLLAIHQEVEAQIRTSSPHYAALTQPVPLNLREMQQQLLDPDTLLLEYSLGDERSYLWALTKTSLKSFVLPPRNKIEAEARRVYELLTARNRHVKFETAAERQVRITRADMDCLAAATSLSEMLLSPAAALLGKNRLLIVSDGALHYVPFAALPMPPSQISRGKPSQAPIASLQPLIVDHEIINLPSALSLAILRREVTGRKPAAKTLAVLADPVFDKDDERVRTNRAGNRPYVQTAVTQDQNANRALQTDLLRSVTETAVGNEPIEIQRLPFTRREADQIAALIPRSERKEALDFAASRATATSHELSQYRYVHFATHGFLNSTHPELSGIVLSLVDEGGLEQDGFLRAYEVFNLRLPAEMVVLSGCRTGLGKEIKGEGLVGLSRGFMYAGAARVLVSLWDVSDEASAELMARLYREMLGKEHLRPAAALRAAQIKIWREKQWQAPYYWAAFVLQGEPR